MVLLLAVFVYVGIVAIGIVPDNELMFILDMFGDEKGRLIWALGAAILFVAGFPLLFFSRKTKKDETDYSAGITSMREDGGSLFITIPAFEDLSKRYLATVQGIVLNGIRIVPTAEKKLLIDIRVSAKPGASIPVVTEKINTELKEYILKYTGVDTQSIDITMLPYRDSETK